MNVQSNCQLDSFMSYAAKRHAIGIRFTGHDLLVARDLSPTTLASWCQITKGESNALRSVLFARRALVLSYGTCSCEACEFVREELHKVRYGIPTEFPHFTWAYDSDGTFAIEFQTLTGQGLVARHRTGGGLDLSYGTVDEFKRLLIDLDMQYV